MHAPGAASNTHLILQTNFALSEATSLQSTGDQFTLLPWILLGDTFYWYHSRYRELTFRCTYWNTNWGRQDRGHEHWNNKLRNIQSELEHEEAQLSYRLRAQGHHIEPYQMADDYPGISWSEDDIFGHDEDEFLEFWNAACIPQGNYVEAWTDARRLYARWIVRDM